MRLRDLLAAAVVVSCVLTQINCITNREFFDLFKGSTDDLVSADLDDVDENDILDLPGNADDELDIGYMLTKLDLPGLQQEVKGVDPESVDDTEADIGDYADTDDELSELEGRKLQYEYPMYQKRVRGWFSIIIPLVPHIIRIFTHRHRRHIELYQRLRRSRHYDYRLEQDQCNCRYDQCRCILNHVYRVMGKRFAGIVHIDFGPAKGRRHLIFKVSANERPVFYREISLHQSEPICTPIGKYVNGCMEIHSVSVEAKKACLRMTAMIHVKNQKLRVPLEVGCFSLPMLDSFTGEPTSPKLLDPVEDEQNDGTNQVKEVSLAEYQVLYRQIQNDEENESESQQIRDLILELEEGKGGE